MILHRNGPAVERRGAVIRAKAPFGTGVQDRVVNAGQRTQAMRRPFRAPSLRLVVPTGMVVHVRVKVRAELQITRGENPMALKPMDGFDRLTDESVQQHDRNAEEDAVNQGFGKQPLCQNVKRHETVLVFAGVRIVLRNAHHRIHVRPTARAKGPTVKTFVTVKV